MKGLWTQKLSYFFPVTPAGVMKVINSGENFVSYVSRPLPRSALLLPCAIQPAGILVIDAYWLLMFTDTFSTGSSQTWFAASGVRLSGVLFNEGTQTYGFYVTAEGRKELFPIAMSSWVNQTTACSIVAGLLLQFKHCIGTATNEEKDDVLVRAWIPSRFSI